MTMPTLECPKCGQIVPEASECARCGVVFAKIRADEPPSATRIRAFREPPEQEQPARPLRLEPILGLAVLLALGALAGLQWVEGRDAEMEASSLPIASTRPRTPRGPTVDRSAEPVPRVLLDVPASSRPSALPASPERVAEPPKARWVDPDSTWFQGAAGFDRGFERARNKNQAVLVYFHTDWCGYCRQLESELLNRAVVQEYTKYLVKIKVNPEKGDRERALANRYGVTGYPSVFVHPAGLGGAKKVRRMAMKKGEPRVLSPRDYVEVLIGAAGEDFGSS